jgi:hypothetical protein
VAGIAAEAGFELRRPTIVMAGQKREARLCSIDPAIHVL